MHPGWISPPQLGASKTLSSSNMGGPRRSDKKNEQKSGTSSGGTARKTKTALPKPTNSAMAAGTTSIFASGGRVSHSPPPVNSESSNPLTEVIESVVNVASNGTPTVSGVIVTETNANATEMIAEETIDLVNISSGSEANINTGGGNLSSPEDSEVVDNVPMDGIQEQNGTPVTVQTIDKSVITSNSNSLNMPVAINNSANEFLEFSTPTGEMNPTDSIQRGVLNLHDVRRNLANSNNMPSDGTNSFGATPVGASTGALPASIQRSSSMNDMIDGTGRKRHLHSENSTPNSDDSRSPHKAPYQRLQSERDKLVNELRKLQGEFNSYKDSVLNGTLLSHSGAIIDELKETQTRLQGAVDKNRELERDLKRNDEYYKEITSQLQEQINRLKLDNERINAQNRLLIAEVKKLSGRELEVTATHYNTRASNVDNTNNMGMVNTVINGRVVNPSPNTDNTLIASRLNSLRNSRPNEVGEAMHTVIPGLPQRNSRQNTFQRSVSAVSAVDSLAGGGAESVASGISDNLMSDSNQNNGEKGQSKRRKKKGSNKNSSNNENVRAQVDPSVESTRELIREILREAGLQLPSRGPSHNQSSGSAGANGVNGLSHGASYAQRLANSAQQTSNNGGRPLSAVNAGRSNDAGRQVTGKGFDYSVASFPPINSRGVRRSQVPSNLSQARPVNNASLKNTVKFVYRPLPDESGKIERVSVQLQKQGIKSIDYGVRTFQQLPDGALSVVFESKEHYDKFNAMISEKRLKVLTNQPVVNPFEFRIHRLSASILPSQIKEAILRQYSVQAIEVTIQQYRDVRFKGTNFAVVRCTRELFEKARDYSSISIGWEKYRIDTSPLPMRCRSCGLLGHTTKRCDALKIPDEIKNKLNNENSVADITEAPFCVDCSYQNFLNRGNRFYTVRSTDHNRNTNECKTYAVLRRRRFRAFRDVPIPGETLNTEGLVGDGNDLVSTDIEMDTQNVATGPIAQSQLINDHGATSN